MSVTHRRSRAAGLLASGAALLAVLSPAAHAAVTPSTLVGWGADDAGQLTGRTAGDVTAPRALSGISNVIGVAAGWKHTVALRVDGSVWAWGLNSHHQLGDGTRTDRAAPRRVEGIADVCAVAASGATTFALRCDGSLWVWGADDYGQLGRGTQNEAQPTPIATGLTGIRAVSGGRGFVLALRQDGTVLSWGADDYGQLGRDNGGEPSPTPAAVPGLSGARSIAAGGYAGYAVLSDGTVRAWGYAAGGALGDPATHDGTTGPESTTTPVAVAGVGGSGTLGDVAAISAGTEHVLALRADGTVVGWGTEYEGELGQGADATDSYYAPVALPALTDVAQVGGLLAGSAARRADGRVWTWGSNAGGRLGVGSGDDVLPSVAVPAELPGLRVAALGAMTDQAEHTIAIAMPPATVGPAGLAFPEQPLGTLGAVQTVTVTAGFHPLAVRRIVATGPDADDFLVVGDGCAGETVAPGESCTAQVRFAPSAAGARSATLVVRSDEAGPLEVALTGTGGALPQGPAGPSGEQGPAGPSGERGADGAPGQQGERGPSGPQGSAGTQGAPGPKGAAGERGATGPRGRDARVTCSVSGRRRVRCTVTYAGARAGTRTRAKASAQARLLRGDRTVARGTLDRLRAGKPLARGRYVLVIGAGRDRVRVSAELRVAR